MRVVCLLVVLLAVIATCNAQCNPSAFMQGKFSRCQTLSSEYEFFWNIASGNVTIALHLTGYDHPWLGLGISVNGGMKGGDIALARVIDGKYVLEDRYATKFAQPSLDVLQNVHLISATSTNNDTIIVYTRKLISCDVDEDQPINANSTQVIFSYGTGEFQYHGPDHRGTVVVFFYFEPAVLPLPETTLELNITIPPYEMPSKDTTYTCASYVLPNTNKYHIVRWRPIIKNPRHVHHVVLFGCYFNANTPVPYECPMAPSSAGCGSVLIAWTIGQDGNDYLTDHAIPIGNNTVNRYVVMQIHYNNPESESGVIDESGLQIFYTPQLRTYDVGTVPISVPWGATPTKQWLVLPAGQKQVEAYTRCHGECTSKSLPADGVTIINWFPHMHKLGSRIWLSHIRNGVELPEIHRDDHYDFERQQNFPVWRTILPGDSLIMHCVWDTTGMSEPTYGGESSSEEMCIGIFQYFPATAPAPTFTRCTDLHVYFNTSGEQPGWSTCTSNNQTTVNPWTNATTQVTPVITNAAYTHLPTPESTCEIDSSTASTLGASVQIALFVVLCALLF